MDAFDMYLEEIGPEKALSLEEQQALAVRIQEGDEQALDALVRSATKFVVAIARGFKRTRFSDADMEDLVGWGNIGLVEAARRYDPVHGKKILTYAEPWIKKRIREGMRNGSLVRQPQNGDYDIARKNELEFKKKGYSERDAENLAVRNLGLSLEVYRGMKEIENPGFVSVDAPIRDGGDASRLETWISGEPEFTEEIEQTDVIERVRRAIQDSDIDPIDKVAMRLRYGIEGEGPMILEEVGKRIGDVTRERARQRINRGLGKLAEYVEHLV